MKLYYRGIAYEYAPDQRPCDQAPQAPYDLKYRGISYHVDPNQATTQSQIPAIYNLTYRGVRYQVARMQEQVVVQSTPVNAPATKLVAAPATFPQRYVAKVHQANLLENLNRRLCVAREHGDQKLVSLLEAEQRQIQA